MSNPVFLSRLAAERIFDVGVRTADPRNAMIFPLLDLFKQLKESNSIPRDVRMADILALSGATGINAMISALRDPFEQRKERNSPLKSVKRVHILALGKAAGIMAKTVVPICKDSNLPTTQTIVRHDFMNIGIGSIIAGHPIPNQESVRGANALLKQAQAATEDDLCLVLLSGGGSALAASPARRVTLPDKIKTTEELLACGADIREVNIVRKHLSAFKGGRLARACHPAQSVVLIISDVVGDDPSTIASGPMSPDPSTYRDAWDIIEKYELLDKLPGSVYLHLIRGIDGAIDETPTADDPTFANVIKTTIIASNRTSIRAMAEKVEKSHGRPIIHPEPITGEARNAAQKLVAQYKDIPHPAMVIGGGETTVTLRGRGKGGRNQEMALAFAIEAEKAGLTRYVFLSGGTDGRDGPTDAAGAIVDDATLTRMKDAKIDPREKLILNDSHPALMASDDLIMTGDTGTNVADLQVLVLY